MAVMEYRSPVHPVADALQTIASALDRSADAPCWSLSDAQVEGLAADAHRLEGRLQELALRLVSEVDRRQVSTRKGATSTRAWLRRELRLTPRAAKQRTVLAAALSDKLELTRQALAAGDITREHARVVVKVMDTLPAGLGQPVRERAERQLIAWCRDFDPGEVARLGRRLWEVIDPEGADAHEAKLLDKQEHDARRKRHLSFGPDGFGLFRLTGRFDPESAAVIAAALDGLAKPLPSTADGPHPRTALCRRPDRAVPPPVGRR